MIKLKLDLQHVKLKLLADISIDQQPTILSFLSRVLNICQITDVNAEELELYDGEYVLPHLLSSKYIKTDGNYAIRNRKLGKKEALASKANGKAKQRTNNKRLLQQLSSSSQSSSSSSLEQAAQLKQIKKTVNSNFKQKANMKNRASSSQSSSQIIIPNKVNQKGGWRLLSINKQDNTPKPKKASAKVVARQSSSESDSPIPANPKNKHSIQQNKSKVVQNKAVANRVHKQVKKMSPDSESSDESCDRKIRSGNYASKVQQTLLNVNQKFHKAHQNQGQQNENTKPKSIPMALRNKPNKAFIGQESLGTKVRNKEVGQVESKVEKVDQSNKFIIGQQIQQPATSHQQSKWVSITKEVLKKWEQQHVDSPIFDPQNSIRFKVMQLDEQKFVPVTTGWISGMIEKCEKKGASTHVNLVKVSKQPGAGNGSAEFLQQFSVPLHNMQELQISRATLTTLQKQIIQTQEPKAETIRKQQKQKPKVNSQLLKPEQSLNDYVCGQISYYFSDKNYPHDLFMKMNANKDQGRFIDVRLMTNFGKIKKVITDDEKVWQFLVNDQKLKSRSYQLDLDRRMLRKK